MNRLLKHTWLCLLLLMAGVGLVNAQQKQKFTVANFELDHFDLTAKNDAYKKVDGNGDLYAIIKVTSTNPDDDLRAYNFSFGNMNSLVEVHDGELWVYVQRNAKMVTISRNGYNTINKYDLQATIEEGRTYTMKLSSQGPVIYTQMVQFLVSPANSKAIITVRKQDEDVKNVLGIVDNEGILAKNMTYGVYTYEVMAENYYPSEGRFTLNDENQTHQEKVTLRPRFAMITLQVASNADIYVNGERKGLRTWSGPLTAGSYQVECRQQNHRSTTQTITVEENQPQTISLQAPSPITGKLSVISSPSNASITIDGKDYGMTPRNINDLLIGNHQLKLSKTGYNDLTQTVTVKENEMTEISLAMNALQDKNAAPTIGSRQNGGMAGGTDPLGLCPDGNHPHQIDMGDGVKWSCCNVGAKSPIEYGEYFAWGETTTKSTYDWKTYKYCKGSDHTMTKYCTSSSYGTVDNKTQLELSDDAARANWGGTWRMPTIDELSTLNSNCTWTWTTIAGVNGYKVTAKNGNVLFFPAAGYRNATSLYNAGSGGYYWSSSLRTSYADSARGLFFSSGGRSPDNLNSRYRGQSVRPVTE